jgi:hypothetical protein
MFTSQLDAIKQKHKVLYVGRTIARNTQEADTYKHGTKQRYPMWESHVVGGHNCGEGKNTNTMISNADNLDSRKIIPIVLKKSSRGWIEN